MRFGMTTHRPPLGDRGRAAEKPMSGLQTRSVYDGIGSGRELQEKSEGAGRDWVQRPEVNGGRRDIDWSEATAPQGARRRTGSKVRGQQQRTWPPGPRASKPAGHRAGPCAAPCATHPLRTESPRSRKCPAATNVASGTVGFQARTATGQAHAPRPAPRTRCGLKVRAPGNAPQQRAVASGTVGFQARRPAGRPMRRALRHAPAADWKSALQEMPCSNERGLRDRGLPSPHRHRAGA